MNWYKFKEVFLEIVLTFVKWTLILAILSIPIACSFLSARFGWLLLIFITFPIAGAIEEAWRI